MTFTLLKRHTNVIEINGENGIKASKSTQEACKSLVCYELSSRSHGGNEPFPRRERTVPTKGTDCFHEGNELFPRREPCVTFMGTFVRNKKKNQFPFCISLTYSYLCMRYELGTTDFKQALGAGTPPY
jgi:hypothetical protein